MIATTTTPAVFEQNGLTVEVSHADGRWIVRSAFGGNRRKEAFATRSQAHAFASAMIRYREGVAAREARIGRRPR